MNAINASVFSEIYRRGLWGRDNDYPFFSGSGSHDGTVVSVYLSAVTNYLQAFTHFFRRLPRVLDVGCGDFSVGAQLRECASDYIALDVVSELIEYNKTRYQGLNVEFVCADAASWSYPPVDVVLVRQVFQHLSNVDVAAAVGGISAVAKCLIVTEHLPKNDDFTSNLDIPSVGSWRLGLNSGVVLTDSPFLLEVADAKVLCSVDQLGGRIVSMAYRF